MTRHHATLSAFARAGAAAALALTPVAAHAVQSDSELIRSIEQRISMIEGYILAISSDRNRRMTVPVQISGEGPFDFMVDTGAQATVVTPALSERFAMTPTGTATLVGMSSSAQVTLVDFDGLQFAGRQFDNLRAPLLKESNIGADGILGLDSLQGLRVIIDFRDRTMTVGDAYDAGGSDGFEIVVRARRKLGQMIITNAMVDGVRTAVIIDTGAQGSVGNAALMRRVRGTKQGQSIATDVNGVTTTNDIVLAREVTIAGLALSRVPMSYGDGPAFAALGLDKKPALILGMQNLRSFDRVAIDFASREILFDLPASARSSGRSKLRPNARGSRIKES